MLGLAASALASFPWLPTGAAAVAASVAGAVWGRRAGTRRLAHALAGLEDAARSLEAGEPVHVAAVAGAAGFAERFNAMADALAERDRVSTELAMSDPETGMPNRRALERELGVLAASGQEGAVVAVSIDRFDELRAAVGREAATALLNDIADRLAKKAPAALVGRLASDTLCIVFPAGGVDAAQTAARELARQVEGTAPLGGASADVRLTLGAAPTAGPDGGEPSALVRASIAVAQARASRRRLAIFDAGAYGDPAANISLMGEMAGAIETGQLEVHLQPKYDIRLGRTAAVEALVRWPHPRRGLLSPGAFVPLAETTGHIRALTDHVLARAIASQAALHRAGHALDVSVNITARQLCDADFIEQTLALADGAAGRIWLEVSGAAFAGDPEQALRCAERCAEAGVGVSIDDFGAGPLSLVGLRQASAEEVKIDKALILDLADDRRNTLLVRGAIELAHGLGMKVTAKGVETNEAFALLAGMGCDYAQGFLIERAMPLDELLAFLAHDRAARFG